MDKTKLLIVDDEPGIRKVLGISLADQGFAVSEAPDGESALAQIAEDPPAIVLLDIKMPGLDGIEVLARIKESWPETEVIMITGHGDMELAILSLQKEATDFIVKPIRDDQLEIALNRALERRGFRQKLAEYTENLERLVKEQAAKLVEAERLAAVGQALEGLVLAMNGIAGDLENGIRFFNEIPCMVSIHGRDLKVLAANRLYREKLGERLGEPSFSVYAGEASSPEQCPAGQTFRTGKGLQKRETVRAADGSPIPVVVVTAPIKSDRGETALVVEIAADVDEIKRLHKDLAAAREHLAALGLLLSSVSHSIKGLLARLDAGAFLLDEGLAAGDREQIGEAREIIRLSASRIKKMVLDILFYAKDRDLEWESQDIREFCEDVARSAGPLFSAGNTGFSTDFDQARGLLRADLAMLRSALLNLLENAADACSSDSEKPAHRVLFSAGRQGDDFCFTVSDNGCGMEKETVDRLFTLFFSSKGRKGTGLGLYLARGIVKKHNGDISVESERGKGSCFRVRIPVPLPRPGE